MRLYPPTIQETEDFYFNRVRGCSNSALREVRDILDGTSTIFSESALRAGKIPDAILTQIHNLPEDVSPAEAIAGFKIAMMAVSNPIVRIAMEHGESQAVFQKEIEVDYQGAKATVLGKCMLDDYIKAINTGIDYKTTACRTQEEFIKTGIERYKYHIQGSWYTDIAELKEFIFIGLPKKGVSKDREAFIWSIKKGSDLYLRAKEEISRPAYYFNVFFPGR
jgi:hypothetical protein